MFLNFLMELGTGPGAWKTRGVVENIGLQWKTRGLSEKHMETIILTNYEFSLSKFCSYFKLQILRKAMGVKSVFDHESKLNIW